MINESRVSDFDNKIVQWLIKDVTQVLDINSGENQSEGGPNFLAMISVLIAIETVSQFLEEADLDEFSDGAKAVYSTLNKEMQVYVCPRYKPIKSSNLPITFMERFFDKQFKEKKPFTKGENLAHYVWKFRNAHAHMFYPFQDESNKVRGSVAWYYRFTKEQKSGIYFNEIIKIVLGERTVAYGTALDSATGISWLQVSPHILFSYFVEATGVYIEELKKNDELYNREDFPAACCGWSC